jgi:hypothetical protein
VSNGEIKEDASKATIILGTLQTARRELFKKRPSRAIKKIAVLGIEPLMESLV